MKILFIGSRLFDDVYYYLKEKGIESILTESNENALNLDLADECFIVPRGMEAPMQIAISQEVDGIIPLIGIDPPLIDVAIMKERIEEEYGIPVVASNISSVLLTSDKIKTKSFFKDIGIDTPEFKVLTKDNFKEELTFDFPVVLKQGQGQGGKDIKIAKDIFDVEEYFKDFEEALCEKFIDGSEISIEVLGFNGKFVPLVPIYKGETTLEGIHPLNKIKTGPCEIENLDNSIIQDFAYKIASSLGSDGIFEMDFMFSKEDNRLYAIEINTRPNGTRYLTDATCGINTLLKLIDMVCGDFSVESVKEEMASYYSTEIPIGNYNGPKPSEPIKSFKNNNFVVHGPEGYQRITIRADSKDNLNKLTERLIGKKPLN